MRFLLTCLIFLLLFPFPSFGQSSERPEGIVIPVSTLGNVSETRRQILQNTLIESLSQYYRLVPQDKFEEVQEKVFQELEYEECTEDQCIVMIQEMLQVENLFVLQVIGESQDTQLSLKWVGLDDKRVKTDVCLGCGTFELNERVEGLVRNLESEIPKGVVTVSRDDEEELRKQREEELRRQREEENRKKREEELRKQREEKQEDGDDLKSLNIVKGIYQNRKYNILGMWGSSDVYIKREPSTTSKYIGDMVFNGFGIGFNYYIWDNYHINSNYFYGTLSSISKITSDKSTIYDFNDVGKVSDTSSSEFYDMFGKTSSFSGSFNRYWIYKKWNFWSGGGLYSESGKGTIITTNDKISTSFDFFGPLFDGGFDYNFENRLNLFFRLNYGFFNSSITQEVNNVNYQTDVTSSMKVYFGMGYNL